MENTISEAQAERASFNNHAYLDALLMCEDPAVTFHSSRIDDELLEKLSHSDTFVAVDGVPLLLNVEDANDLVNYERCIKLARNYNPNVVKGDVQVALMPATYLVTKLNELKHINGSTTQYIFAEYDKDAPGSNELEQGDGNGYIIHNLVHETAQTTAGQNIYEAITHSAREHSLPILNLGDVVDLGVVVPEVAEPAGGLLKVKRGGQFSDKEMDELWELFSARFQDITDNMPIRLEETKEGTLELFENPSNIFSFNVEANGKITCAAFGTEDYTATPWISPVFLDSANKKVAQETGREPYAVFVPGVASYKGQSMNVSRQVLNRLTDCIAATGNHDIIFRFECTDVSSLYIPRIVSKVLKQNAHLELVVTRQLGQKKYILIEVPATD